MFCSTPRYLFGFLLVFMLHQVTVGLICKPGQMATISRDRCVSCPDGQYRPEAGDFVECNNCRPCGDFSKLTAACTSTSNTQCQCLHGFTAHDQSQEDCICETGSGIQGLGTGEEVCEKCPNGTFSSIPNSSCTLWTNISSTVTAPSPTSTLESQTSTNTSTGTTISTQTSSTSPSADPSSETPISKQHGLWLVPLGSILVLLFIQFIIIKLRVISCFRGNKKTVIRQDSVCGKPVEESGETLCSPAV